MHKWSERKTPSKPACSAIRTQARIVARLDCGPMLRIATPNFIAIPPERSRTLASMRASSQTTRPLGGDRRVGRPSAKQRKPYNLDAILDVAVRVFRERGYDGSSLDDVARAAGITKARTYYHLPRHEELLPPRVGRPPDA